LILGHYQPPDAGLTAAAFDYATGLAQLRAGGDTHARTLHALTSILRGKRSAAKKYSRRDTNIYARAWQATFDSRE